MDLTIPAAVASAARQYGGHTAVADPHGPRLSYRDLHERVAAVAGTLIAHGIEPQDRVAVWSPNTCHWVLGALGALYAGATLVPVNTRFTGPEALDVIGRSGARALIVADRFLGTDRLGLLRAAASEPSHSHYATSACLSSTASDSSSGCPSRPLPGRVRPRQAQR